MGDTNFSPPKKTPLSGDKLAAPPCRTTPSILSTTSIRARENADSSTRFPNSKRRVSAPSPSFRSASGSSSNRCCATSTERRSPKTTSARSPTGRRRAERTEEIPFMVARVLLQDFTGVPLLVDLAAMRSAAARFEKDPEDHRAARSRRSGHRSLRAGRLRESSPMRCSSTWTWSSSATSSAISF